MERVQLEVLVDESIQENKPSNTLETSSIARIVEKREV